MPDGLVERITFAIGLDDIDAEFMRLTEEVLVPAGARGAEHVRTITFGGESVTVMVTVTQEGRDVFRLDGWLAPSAALEVELRRADGSLATTADDDGRFVFSDIPAGLAQLILHPTAGSADRAAAATWWPPPSSSDRPPLDPGHGWTGNGMSGAETQGLASDQRAMMDTSATKRTEVPPNQPAAVLASVACSSSPAASLPLVGTCSSSSSCRHSTIDAVSGHAGPGARSPPMP